MVHSTVRCSVNEELDRLEQYRDTYYLIIPINCILHAGNLQISERNWDPDQHKNAATGSIDRDKCSTYLRAYIGRSTFRTAAK
jgi:hypothetical protein